MLSAHIAMHHKLHRKIRAFTGLENHRTDGRNRRSATFDDFNIRLLIEAEGFVSNVRNSERGLNGLAQFHVA